MIPEFSTLLSMLSTPWLMGGFLALSGYWFYQTYTSSGVVSTLREIPGPKPHSEQEGNIPDIAKSGSLTEFLIDIHKEFGPIASFYQGPTKIVSIASPQLFRQVVHLFDRPVVLFKNLEPLISVGSTQFRNGEYGQHMRKISDRSFSHNKLMDKLPMFQKVGDDLVKRWVKGAETSEHLPLSEHMYDTVMRGLTRYAFGDYFKNDEALHEFRKDYDHVFWILENFLVAGPLKPGSDEEKSFNAGLERMKTVINNLLKERQDAEIPPEDKIFVDTLLDTIDNEDDLFGDVISYLIAGSHTTSFFLFWAVYHLAQHPELQEKCYEEITHTYTEGPITWEIMKDMKYLQAVLNETQRLTPLAPYAARYSETDMELDGYHLPAETPILLGIHTMAWDDKLWKEPQKFNPERFLEPVESYKFEPFGIGKRKCPGYRMAEIEAQLLLILLLKNFKVTLVPNQPVKYKYGILVKPDVEIYVTVEKR